MGNKSYWFEGDQKGNFSNNGKDTFDPKKSYTGIRLQQGVPLLDRDWNELEDIRRYQEMMLRKTYLGNGTPDDGFRISACNPAGMDFQISYGRFLVDGLEAVNRPGEYANFSNYTAQKNEPALKPLSGNEHGIFYYTVYLDLWIDEITASEEPALNNNNDIKICTSVRHRIQWRVKVKEWVFPEVPIIAAPAGHHYIELAKIKRSTKGITDNDITDLRSTWHSLEGTEQRFKSIINELLRGNMPSEPETNLTGTGGIELIKLIKDSPENISIFFNKGNKSYLSYFKFSIRWTETIELSKKLPNSDNSVGFADEFGTTYIFWQEDGKSESGQMSSSIFFQRFNSGNTIGKIEMVVSEIDVKLQDIMLQDIIDDSKGYIYVFWLLNTKDINRIYCRLWDPYNGKWNGKSQESPILQMPLKDNERLHIIRDDQGYINLFWLASDANIFWGRYDIKQGKWQKNVQITQGTKLRSNLQILEDINKNIWLFWIQPEGIFSIKRDSNKGWEKEFNTVVTAKFNVNAANKLSVVGDNKGRIFLIWKQAFDEIGLFHKVYYNGWKDSTLVNGADPDSAHNVFVDPQGAMWLLFQKKESKNTWCKRYISGEWVDDMRLLSDEKTKDLITMFEGRNRDAWLFWRNLDDKTGDIWCKRFYRSV
jgi:hypothetical protein